MEKIYDLEERLKNFHLRTIRLCKSAGANYCEASEAMSKKDFVKSLKTSRKELREYSIWVAGLKEAADFADPEFDALLQESKELTYILTSIIKKTDV